MTSREKVAPAYEQVESLPVPPPYGLGIDQAYKQWKSATKAATELDTVQANLSATQKELDAASSELRRMKEKSSVYFETLHAKKKPLSSLLSLGKSKSKAGDSSSTDAKADKITEAKRRETAKANFESAHAEEMKQATLVERIQGNVAEIQKGRDRLQSTASRSNEFWNALAQTPEAMAAALGSRSSAIGALLGEVTGADSAYELAAKSTVDLTRARLTVQHAHKYFNNTLKICDDLNPNGLGSVAAEGMGGEFVSMTKANDYRIAMAQAHKAQVCLDECFRVLQPHLNTLPEDVLETHDALKKSGVSQASKIYDLKYFGGSTADVNIRKSVKTLLERQEAAFGHLTRLAVWLQDRVPVAESEEKIARTRRDSAREKLASLWMQNGRHY